MAQRRSRRMRYSTIQERVKFWHAQDLGKLELLRATYITHSFSPHTHNGYAIGVIEAGAETFCYRGNVHIAPAGSIVVINPGEMHTGQAVDEAGWSYRMLYPEVDLVQKAALEVFGRQRDIPDFANPVIWDKELAGIIRRLHITLENSVSKLERESLFVSALAQLIARHAGGRPQLRPEARAHRAIMRAKEYLETHYTKNISLDQLAATANLSPFHFTRVFREVVGLPPHTYLTQIRIERAKTLLSQDLSIAQVAGETGFVDQSHLTRRFKRIVGVTPGQYALNSKNIQDN